ncbi:Metal-pseudopaline receptor CntO [Halomonadaceae bacterium LMG 33818]|uniref:TonB-dependent siderophore receptor n=1 Tax=Cernens ardua TaxID=3402176 RepID=UPI003EDC200E
MKDGFFRLITPQKRDRRVILIATFVGATLFYANLCFAEAITDTAASSQKTTYLNTMTVEGKQPGYIPLHGYTVTQSSIAGKRPVSFLDDPHTVNVVTSQVIEDQNSHTLDDALASQAGITLGNSMGGTEDGFVKRGFGSNQDGSILVDGIRQPRGTLSLATIDHVESLMGPASMFRGQQDPGGVINLVTKKPEYHARTLISGNASSFGGGNGTVDITGPLGQTGLAYRLIADRTATKSWREFGKNRRTIIAPSLRWEGEHDTVNLAYTYSHYNLDMDRGTLFVKGQPVHVGRRHRFDEPWSHVFGHDNNVTGWWQHSLSHHWYSRTTYAFIRRQYSDGQPRVISVNPLNGNIKRRADANHGFDRREQYASFDFIGHTLLMGMRHDVVVGVDHEFQRDYLLNKYVGTAVIDANLYSDQEGELEFDPASLNNAKSNRLDEIKTYGLYASDSIQLTPHWILGMGARYTWFKQYDGQGRPFRTTNDTLGKKLLPALNLLYKITPSTSAYVSYSESFIPNAGNSESVGALAPELGKGYEIGLKHQWSDRLTASADIYRIRKNNVAVTDNGIMRTVGKAGSQGFEFNLAGQITPTLSLLTSYAYTSTRVISDTPDTVGNQLPNSPHGSVRLLMAKSLDLTPGMGNWRLGGGVRYIGARQGDAKNTFKMNAYVVADMFIAWNPRIGGKQTHVQLNFNNMFNKTYYASSGGSQRVAIGAPREVTLSGNIKF